MPGSIQLGGVILILLARCIQWRGAQASRLVLFSDGAECRHWTHLLKSPANEDGVVTFTIRPTAMDSALHDLEDMPSVVLTRTALEEKLFVLLEFIQLMRGMSVNCNLAAEIVDVFCSAISAISNKRGLPDEKQEILDILLS
jgi:hypothetical protein